MPWCPLYYWKFGCRYRRRGARDIAQKPPEFIGGLAGTLVSSAVHIGGGQRVRRAMDEGGDAKRETDDAHDYQKLLWALHAGGHSWIEVAIKAISCTDVVIKTQV